MPTTTIAAPPAKLAAPCARCATRAGYGAPGQRPARTRRLCKACYGEVTRAGRLAHFPAGPPRVERVTIACHHCGEPFLALASHHRRFCSKRCANAANGPEPRALPPLVRPADVGIDPAEVAARLAATADRLLLETRRAERLGLAWRREHPWQFARARLADLFPFGLTCARWALADDGREAGR